MGRREEGVEEVVQRRDVGFGWVVPLDVVQGALGDDGSAAGEEVGGETHVRFADSGGGAGAVDGEVLAFAGDHHGRGVAWMEL